MRCIFVLLATLVTMGCGAGSGRNPIATKVSTVVAPPAITALSPVSVPANSVPFTMTINGNNFGSDAIVFWNGVPQQTTVITSKQLMVSITNSDLMAAGLVPVFVRSTGLNSNTVDFVLTIQ